MHLCFVFESVLAKISFWYPSGFVKVVGAIDQMDVDETAITEKNSGSAVDSKNIVKTLDSDKAKGRRKLFVGSQSLGFRRDHMDVSLLVFT